MAKKEVAKKIETPEVLIAKVSKEIVALEKESLGVVTIVSREDMTKATTFLANIKGRLTSIEEWRTFFTKPLVEQKRRIDDLFKAQSQPLQAMVDKVKGAMSKFAMEEEQKARAEEKRLQELQDKKNAKLEAKGKEIDYTPAPVIEREAATIHTEAGRSTQKKVWKFEVIDEAKVPREFCKVDEAIIRRSVLNGAREIKGVRIYEDFDFSVSSNK